MKSSTYYFHMKTKILADFENCISVPLSVLQFFTNRDAQFISYGIGCSHFSSNLLLSFLSWHDFKILVKSRGVHTFLCLALSVNVQLKHFLKLKAKCPVFYFLDLNVGILNLVYISENWKKRPKFALLLKVFLFSLPGQLWNCSTDLT